MEQKANALQMHENKGAHNKLYWIGGNNLSEPKRTTNRINRGYMFMQVGQYTVASQTTTALWLEYITA